ncbi:MAG: hypothetical protein V1717_00755 [Candidatus Micrarchaeota archaeon]
MEMDVHPVMARIIELNKGKAVNTRTVTGLVHAEGVGVGNRTLSLYVRKPHAEEFKRLLQKHSVEYIEYTNEEFHTFHVKNSQLIDAFNEYKHKG